MESKKPTQQQSLELISYRLEKTEQQLVINDKKQDERFNKLEAKIDGIANGFATQVQLAEAVKERDKKIEELSERITALEVFTNNILKKISAVAITALVLMIASIYGLDKFIK